MADISELTVALNLRDDLTDAELAELRWHLGLGPRPEPPSAISLIPTVDPPSADDAAYAIEFEVGFEIEDEPLLGYHGEAWKVGGALTSVLVRRRDGWALTSRQEIHPDQHGYVGPLLAWLADRSTARDERTDGSVLVGWTRFYEEDRPEPLVVRDGRVDWP
ncbi:hypothetical protein [Streptomyces sp. NPDC047097]|uniref:hypothetical protein n=1 Tax=Streptomyces sp. NPDC047097 TaxID=3155260 RepID=UPI0033CF6615